MKEKADNPPAQGSLTSADDQLPLDIRLSLLSQRLARICQGCSSDGEDDRPYRNRAGASDLIERARKRGEEDTTFFARSTFVSVDQALPVARALIAASLDELPEKPAESERWARLAFALATEHEEPEAMEVSAHAHGFVANARRALHDPEAAADLLGQARELARPYGLRDPLVAGDLDLFEGLLRTRERSFDEAVHLLLRAVGCFACAEQPVGIIRSLIPLSLALNEACQHAEASRIGTVALYWTRKTGLERFEPFCRFNLALFHYEAGESALALAALAELNLARDSRFLKKKVRWLEARLMGATGKVDSAARLLWDLHASFLEEGAFYDAILSVIDLAVLAQQVGDFGQITRLEEALAAIGDKHAPGLSDEARSALGRLRQSLAVFDPVVHEADLRALHFLSGSSPGHHFVSAVRLGAHT